MGLSKFWQNELHIGVSCLILIFFNNLQHSAIFIMIRSRGVVSISLPSVAVKKVTRTEHLTLRLGTGRRRWLIQGRMACSLFSIPTPLLS